jgi:hypothetical protein
MVDARTVQPSEHRHRLMEAQRCLCEVARQSRLHQEPSELAQTQCHVSVVRAGVLALQHREASLEALRPLCSLLRRLGVEH